MTGRTILRENRDGREVAHVPLRGARFALLDAADADRLLAADVPLQSAYLTRLERHGAHVAVPSRRPDLHPVVLVARLVTGAMPGQRVRYRDGDRLNLTRANPKTEDRRKTAAVLTATTTQHEEH